MVEIQLSNVIYVSPVLECNKLNLVDCKYLERSTDPWFYLSCCSTILLLGNLTENDFSASVLNRNDIEISNENSSVFLKPVPVWHSY